MGGFMKKKIIITLLLVIPFISIFLVIIFRGILSPNNEEIIRDLKNIKCYETKVEYIVKNSKGEEREDTVQYYSKDEGVRIEFDDNEVDVFFKCKYFHTLINVLKCMSEVHEEANAVLATLDEAMCNLIKKNNEKA